jgi:hypothetical protein
MSKNFEKKLVVHFQEEIRNLDNRTLSRLDDIRWDAIESSKNKFFQGFSVAASTILGVGIATGIVFNTTSNLEGKIDFLENNIGIASFEMSLLEDEEFSYWVEN